MYNLEAIGQAVIKYADIYKEMMDSVAYKYPEEATLAELLHCQSCYNLLLRILKECKNEDN